jgi:hypothetical protein
MSASTKIFAFAIIVALLAPQAIVHGKVLIAAHKIEQARHMSDAEALQREIDEVLGQLDE